METSNRGRPGTPKSAAHRAAIARAARRTWQRKRERVSLVVYAIDETLRAAAALEGWEAGEGPPSAEDRLVDNFVNSVHVLRDVLAAEKES